MRLAIDSFRGEAPRLTPRELPPNGAQVAINAKLVSGDLEAWRQFVQEKVLANGAPVRTIFLLNGVWLSWEEEVDVARGVIRGDEERADFRSRGAATEIELARISFAPLGLRGTRSQRPHGSPRGLGSAAAPRLSIAIITPP